jgi:hypothetical protein
MFFLVACNDHRPPEPQPDAYPAPAQACDADAGCPPPVSGCTANGWQYYFDNGQCTAGNQCTFETKYYWCECGCKDGDYCWSCGPTVAGPVQGH